ncbi:MAG: gamma-butyrobetaine hydroxylase-like domain-containing protein [Polyangiales bacterium]
MPIVAPSKAPAPQPVTVRAPADARRLEMVWDDGCESAYRHLHLRAFCPCARCQGHQGPIGWQEAADALPVAALALRDIEEVGGYALRLVWGDGHATGIYTFAYLRALAPLADMEEVAVRELTFGR